MNDSIFRISLDIHEHGSQSVLKAKYADTGRSLHISLRDGSTPYIIAEGCYAAFKATKPDGNVLYNACTIEGNEIIYEFTEQTCTAIGRSRCEIALYGSDDKLITSPRFALLVDGTIYPDGRVESTSEFSALTDLVSTTLENNAESTKATNEANTATENAKVAKQNADTATATANQAALEAMRIANEASTATANANEASIRADSAADSARGEAEKATLAADKANEATSTVIRIAKNTMAVGKVAGENVSMDDAVEFGFVGCRIFGKTTQDGTPTPDAPVDLVNIGNSGSITVNVAGDNDAQSMTIATLNGLPGIPVASGGNYADANGQQWICDEIDLARGVYVQRVSEYITPIFGSNGTASGNIYLYSAFMPNTQNVFNTKALSTHFKWVESGALAQMLVGQMIVRDRTDRPVIYCASTIAVESEFNAWVQENNVRFLSILATPIETPLSAEEIAAYASLHTYRDRTTVSNDAGAHMELEYVVDTKKYIDGIMTPPAWLTDVSLPASAWEGSNSLYSQVVTIPGITEYSKVDLLPSVEQLAIFFNKNVSFVTENEDGVVTVYAVGDKPLQDYTMQAQITEVEA